MTRIVKKEVKESCLRMRNSKTGSKEWKRACDVLQRKWKFTPFSLLALYDTPPTIEYSEENYHLVTEEDKKDE